ncbi:hypothetical protein [Lacticaseibacillus parakribbianus]|uniref:hypothetical protein n=1 Tax=Lacticaseibacillus parakribbianus TaxID=2970927 RepID=UPI0021CAFC10|nr:hypothetical protein [Lacticaseibacillus parakribbianus]
MAPNEEWVKRFTAQNGREPTVAEYQAAKATGFDLTGLETAAGDAATARDADAAGDAAAFNAAVTPQQPEEAASGSQPLPTAGQPASDANQDQPEAPITGQDDATAAAANQASATAATAQSATQAPEQPTVPVTPAAGRAAATKRRRTPRKWWQRPWVVLIIALVGVTVIGLGLAVAAMAMDGSPEPPVPAKKAKVAKAKPAAKASSKPTALPTTEEKIALILLTHGASDYSPTGQALATGEEMEEATRTDVGVSDAPADAQVYVLSQTLDEEYGQPFVMLYGNTGYLNKSEDPVTFASMKKYGLRVDLTEAWQKLWQDQTLKKLTGLIKLVSSDTTASDDAADSDADETASDDDSDADDNIDKGGDGISTDPATAWQQMAGTFKEDASTVTGQAQITSFFEQDGKPMWEAHFPNDGAPLHELDLSTLTFIGPHEGANIFNATVRDMGSGKTAPVYFYLYDKDTYVLESKDLNYYGKFNRE